MKKSFVFVALAAVIAMCATSCKKDESVLKFTATIERGSGKTSLNGWADDTRQVVWSEGDQIKVWGDELGTYANLGYICNLTSGTGATTAEFEVATPDTRLDESASFTAVYPADGWMHSDEVYISSNQTYIPSNVFKYPMMAVSSSTHLQFKNVCGIIEVKLPNVENISLAGMKIKADHQISGNYHVIWNDGDPVLTPAGLGNVGGEYDGLFEIEVSFPQVIDLSAGTRPSVLVYLPAGDHNGINIEFYTTNFTYTKITASATTPINVKRSKITTLDFSNAGSNIVWKPMPIHRNYFSVSDDLQVDFANGNLVYGHGSNSSNWFIAQNHWDVYGNYNYFMDLFTYSFGESNNFGVAPVSNTGSFVDWGTLVTPGDNYESNITRWRTLSSTEWNYLIARRNYSLYAVVGLTNKYFTDNARHMFKLGGLLLMPDDWDATVHADLNALITRQEDTHDHNDDDRTYVLNYAQISFEQLNAFLDAGCAFLPAAGSTIGSYPAPGNEPQTATIGYYYLSDGKFVDFTTLNDFGVDDIDWDNMVDWDDYREDYMSDEEFNELVQEMKEEYVHDLFDAHLSAPTELLFNQGVLGDDASNTRFAVRLVRNAKHKVSGEWIYYTGFDPNQNTGAKGKRK